MPGYSWLKVLSASRQICPGAPDTTTRPSCRAAASVVSQAEGLAAGAPSVGLAAGGALAPLAGRAAGLGAQALSRSSASARSQAAPGPCRAGRLPGLVRPCIGLVHDRHVDCLGLDF